MYRVGKAEMPRKGVHHNDAVRHGLPLLFVILRRGPPVCFKETDELKRVAIASAVLQPKLFPKQMLQDREDHPIRLQRRAKEHGD